MRGIKSDSGGNHSKIKITVEIERTRLDKFLGEYFSRERIPISRTVIQDFINSGLVLVNGVTAEKSSQQVKRGDLIECPDTPPVQFTDLVPEDIPISIIYEDNDILIINKKHDMVVHPAKGHQSGTLVNAVLHYLEKDLKEMDKSVRPGIVHRLDKDTTGLMMVAKSLTAFSRLQTMIKKREVTKIYLALVHGRVLNDEARIETPMGTSKSNKKKISIYTMKPKIAISEYSVIQRFKEFTYIKFKLITGRTHQIRVHMSFLGNPVVGDLLYGHDKRIVSIYNRTFNLNHHLLHAAYLEFKHPITGKIMNFEHPVPEEFEQLLTFLQIKEYGKPQV